MLIKRIALSMIERYQRGGGSKHYFNLECNFEPTCSEYTRQAIEHYGVGKGIRLGMKRIRRCSDPDCIHKIQDPLPNDA
ncbi:membrane protein insertion efficiency factor YidD [Photobacterium sanguinicancri]|uniref:Membrane protein insertion efficiency factor YidD n=1 Tax=Photobacterium sanguinicancri TaxID=875932 RepID=A0AAW7Y6L1_9GAMM|nr:membrane protein insertion efficiency factor YidD [Photobacterium sanguinicancri]KXI23535.1 alpha-hemolysin [Photobacterium sanguinicancri]MDO6543931.1 membrane protein insertion efficiency factor YidD [Photobacterium sanguinicancri]OZS42723.1 membrane protein insertion efficiency factor YidD [Photobacterium sanguinicancri]